MNKFSDYYHRLKGHSRHVGRCRAWRLRKLLKKHEKINMPHKNKNNAHVLRQKILDRIRDLVPRVANYSQVPLKPSDAEECAKKTICQIMHFVPITKYNSGSVPLENFEHLIYHIISTNLPEEHKPQRSHILHTDVNKPKKR